MAPLVLEGDTLGSRHRHYNKLLTEAIANNQQPAKIDFDECDIDNFLKIDIACHNKNVPYILDVLTCEDMLYVTRAINRSTWLITDQQYAHIIEPQHLHSQLFPRMTSKGINKLMLHIRINIKDEIRAEHFYNYCVKVIPDEAPKWLPSCSTKFIEYIVGKRVDDIPIPILKRLCKRSFNVFKICSYKHNNWLNSFLKSTTFLMRRNFEEYFKVLHCVPAYYLPKFSPTTTTRIMKKYKQIISYCLTHTSCLDIQALVKCLKKEDIKEFVKNNPSVIRFESLEHFLRRIEDKRCIAALLKSIFNKNNYETDDRSISLAHMTLYHAIESIWWGSPSNAVVLRWYEFAPFGVAFFDLKKLVYTETSPEERNTKLELMITCAGRDMQHIQQVLQYYHDKHINVPYKYKIMFVNKLLSAVDYHTFDEKTWSLLNALFHSLEVYVESSNKVKYCLQAIIVYKVIHNDPIPEIIEKKFEFDTLGIYRNKLNHDDGEKLFTYLKEYSLKNLHENWSENEFNEDVKLLAKFWNLLIDWQRVKEQSHHQLVFEKIKKMVQTNREMSWNIDLSPLYTMLKAWRRHLIAESILMCPSDNVCANALKYDPELLSRYRVEVEAISCNDKVSLKRFLNKLRIYWPHSLAEQWADTYLRRFDQPDGHGALLKGLYTLLPRNQLLAVIKKYAPDETKINWNDSNAIEISLRKHIAKNMHMARPLVPLDVVLLYAKGDYLQFAVHSITAIFYDRYSRHIREHLQKYLEAPVSLQKHGIKLAFTKLETKDLPPVIGDCWKSTKNPTLRSIIFTSTFSLLCKETKPFYIKSFWELISMFIDDLSCEENEAIYAILEKVSKVPISVRAEFYVKSYLFLKSLPAKANCSNILKSVIKQASENMYILDPDFVLNILLAPVQEKFSAGYIYSQIIACYLLCSKDKETQMIRYNNVMKPVLERYSPWDKDTNDRTSFLRLLQCLHENMSQYVFEMKMIMPVSMFADTYEKLERVSTVRQHYIELTAWKLSIAFVQLLDDLLKNSNIECIWDEFCLTACPRFAEICIQHLREDEKIYFQSIYLIFEGAMNKVFGYFNFNDDFKHHVLESMLKYDKTVKNYLLVLNLTPQHYRYNGKTQKICRMLYAHPSKEVKMHYHKKYDNHYHI